MDWQLYHYFLVVMQSGSLSAAARQLRLSQPTLGRKMAELEAALGLALFTRSQKGLTPTQDALRLLPLAEAMAGSAEALQRRALASEETIAGVLRLSASEVISAEVLPPILRHFCDAHPGVVIELVVTNQISDLLRRDVDMAVRMTRPVQDALVTRKIGESRLGLFAHRSYLDRHGFPVSLAELSAHRLIGFDQRRPNLDDMPALDRSMFAWRCDNDLAGLAALRAGFGIGVCQAAIAARDSSLIPLCGAEFRLMLPVWLAMHEELRRAPLMHAAFDHLAQGLDFYLRSREPSESP